MEDMQKMAFIYLPLVSCSVSDQIHLLHSCHLYNVTEILLDIIAISCWGRKSGLRAGNAWLLLFFSKFFL